MKFLFPTTPFPPKTHMPHFKDIKMTTSNSLLAATIVVALVLGACYYVISFVSKPTSPSPESKLELFRTPAPIPLHDFDVGSNNPILYRPFRHGPNHVTMGIRKLNWNSWIEMDSYFLRYHDRKVSELHKAQTERVKIRESAVAQEACFETLEELTKFLTRRYPKIFRLQGGVLENTLTNEKFPYPASTPMEAMTTAAKLVQDDLILMVRREDGQYHLDAGAACLPGFWRLREKFGMSLDTLHLEANVPHYEAKLQRSMNRYFEAMTPDKPVVRNNYFIQLDDGLHWSHRMGEQMGTEVASWETANSKDLTIDEIHFRSERQTLRRLPRSSALLFTVRTYFEPITKVAQEPHVPGRLLEAIEQWDEAISKYKGKHHWEHILLPYLKEQHEIQRASGILEKHSEGEYPF